jgi:hypothetical protein
MPRRTKDDRKFSDECTKLRGINGAVVVSIGEIDECDYDELKKGDFSANSGINVENRQSSTAVGKKLVKLVSR